MAETSGKVGAVYMQTGAANDITGEALGTGDETVFNTANVNVDEDSVVVYMDAAALSRDLYTVAVDGTITFAAAPGAGGNAITGDYDYYTVSEVAGFYDWHLTNEAAVLETTDFQSSGLRTYISSLTGWSATAAKHWLSATFIAACPPGTKLIVKLYADEGNTKRYEGWGIISGVNTDVAVDAVIEEPITIQGTGLLSFETA